MWKLSYIWLQVSFQKEIPNKDKTIYILKAITLDIFIHTWVATKSFLHVAPSSNEAIGLKVYRKVLKILTIFAIVII